VRREQLDICVEKLDNPGGTIHRSDKPGNYLPSEAGVVVFQSPEEVVKTRTRNPESVCPKGGPGLIPACTGVAFGPVHREAWVRTPFLCFQCCLWSSTQGSMGEDSFCYVFSVASGPVHRGAWLRTSFAMLCHLRDTPDARLSEGRKRVRTFLLVDSALSTTSPRGHSPFAVISESQPYCQIWL
jgi:hypothetical protein